MAPETEQTIINLFRQQQTARVISKTLNLSLNSIYSSLYRNHLKYPRRKLSPEQEKLLIRDYNSKVPISVIAKTYCISTTVVSDYLHRNNVSGRDARKYNVDDKAFDTLSEANTWMLGWIWSDGNIQIKKKMFKMTFANKDRELIQKFFNIVQGCSYNQKNYIDYRVTSAPIVKKLIEYGCTERKSLTLQYPITPINDRLFLRGVLEGDGWISFRHINSVDCGISSGSLIFLEQIKSKLLTWDIPTKIYERATSNSKRLVISGGRKNVFRFLERIYEGALEEHTLSRKYKAYLKFRSTFKNDCVNLIG